MTVFSAISDTYDMTWKWIVRPPRDKYKTSDLGPNKFRIGNRVFERRDIKLTNDRGHKLECSHFVPHAAGGSDATLPCIVYCHGSRSSRLESLILRHTILPRDITIFGFDFSGSGHSEGEYVTLGHYEQLDLKCVINHLRSTGHVSKIALWGRSMGAVTCILRAAEERDLAAVVLDSPFSNFPILAEEVVRSYFQVPSFLISLALQTIRSEVKAKAHFDLVGLQPIMQATKCKVPALFCTGKQDDFILPHHSYDLHRAWGGSDRRLITFDGDHTSARPRWFLEEAAEFLLQKLAPAQKDGGGAGALRPTAGDDVRLLVAPIPLGFLESKKVSVRLPSKQSERLGSKQSEIPVLEDPMPLSSKEPPPSSREEMKPGIQQNLIMEKIKKYRCMNRLKQASLLVIAGRAERIQPLRKIFMALDSDTDGLLTPDELQNGLLKAGLELTADFRRFIEDVSGDGASAFDYTELLAATVPRQESEDENACWQAFCMLDADGDGRLLPGDIAQLLDGPQPPGAVDSCIRDVDLNRDGIIDFGEFLAMMRKFE